MCIILLSKLFTSALSWDRLPGVQRDWYQRAGVDSSALVPVVMGVAVCQGQCERPLCSSAAVWYEREDWRQTWIQPCDWARSREQHSSNHTPNFDWQAQYCPSSLFKWKLFIFITSNKTQGTSQVIGNHSWATTADDAACEPSLLRWHLVHGWGSFCLPFHLDGNAPRMSFNKLPPHRRWLLQTALCIELNVWIPAESQPSQNCSLGNANRVSMETMPNCEPSRAGFKD